MIQKLSFSSLGTQELDHQGIIDLVKKCDIYGVELRGKEDNHHIGIDTPEEKVSAIHKLYQQNNVHVVGITSYVKCGDFSRVEENKKDLVAYARLATLMEAEYVRIYFGAGCPRDFEKVGAFIKEAAALCATYPVKLLMEFHDEVHLSTEAKLIYESAGKPQNFGFIYDFNTINKYGENALSAWNNMKDFVGAVHLYAHGDDNGKVDHQVLPEHASRKDFPELVAAVMHSDFSGPTVLLWERNNDDTLCSIEECVSAYKELFDRL